VNYPLDVGIRGVDTLGFDERSRAIYTERKIGGIGFEFRVVYDNADRAVSTTYPDGRTITRQFDGASRLVLNRPGIRGGS
jgi:YD repeat-containing protein